MNNRVILIVAAHSDDEVFGCGGTIARHVSSGDKVHVIFMTNGTGSRNTSSEEIQKRQQAAQNAADILGISSIQQFNMPDNKMDAIALLDVVQLIERVVDKLQPEIIYTHHIGDLNIDHQVTHKAVMTVCRPQPGFCVKEIYAFEVLSSTEWQTPGYKPFFVNKYVDITNYIELKKRAIQAYHVELRCEPHTRSSKNIIRLNIIRGNSVGIECAEAFSIIRIIS